MNYWHAKIAIILVHLRFLQTIGKKGNVQESFLHSNHMTRRATDKNVAAHNNQYIEKT